MELLEALFRLVQSKAYKVDRTGEGSDEGFDRHAYFKLETIWRMLRAEGGRARQGRSLWKRFRKMSGCFGPHSLEPE